MLCRCDRTDLRDVKQIKYRTQPQTGGKIELHLDTPRGQLISSMSVSSSKAGDVAGWREIAALLTETKGIHDLYFVFIYPREEKRNLFNIDWICFSNKNL
jgi:hypothetical protein